MARTQLRLDAVTGSLVSIESAAKPAGVPSVGEAAHLEDVLGHFAGAIKRITGAPSFTEQEAGQFSQALTGSAGMKLDGDLDVGAPANFQASMAVAGLADFNGDVTANKISIDGDVAGHVYVVGPDGAILDEINMFFNETGLHVTGGLEASGAALFKSSLEVDGPAQFDGIVDANAGMSASLVKIDGDVSGRLYRVGQDGEIYDEQKLMWSGINSKLTITGDLAAVSGTFSSDLVVGGDLIVNGTTTTVNSTVVTIEDKSMVLAAGESGAGIQDAGLYISEDESGAPEAYVRWDEANARWQASEQMHAPVLQSDVASALFLKSDADGDIIAGTGADLGAAVMAQLVEGTGVHITEAAGEITIAIGQAVETDSNVEFAQVTLTGMADRLVWSNAGVLEAKDLVDMVAGTEYEIAVADDNAGGISLSLALQLTDATYGALPGDYNSVAHALTDLYNTLGASSKKATYVVAGTVAANSDIAADLSSDFLSELTADNAMIFVNGQLMLATNDYVLDAGAGSLEFTFALEADDVIVVQKA